MEVSEITSNNISQHTTWKKKVRFPLSYPNVFTAVCFFISQARPFNNHKWRNIGKTGKKKHDQIEYGK